MRPGHTDHQYDEEMTRLTDQVVLMGQTVQEMITESVRSFAERDVELADRTIRRDHEVNRLEVETDELCIRMLARRQPVASDLRYITIAMKLVTDLERMGDLCVNICERAIELSQSPPLEMPEALPRMAQAAESMVRQALDAFINRNEDLARTVITQDRIVNACHAQVFRDLLSRMTTDAGTTDRATRIQSIAKYLERIGDHATNVAEMAVFLVRGKDIRHLTSVEESGTSTPRGVLFVCVHNAARSQMAEAWARTVFPPGTAIWSAGSDPAAEVDPRAVRVMAEVGVDIASQRPKSILDVPLGEIDMIVTLCPEEVCVPLPGIMRRETRAFVDPAAALGGEIDVLTVFRQVRDEIKAFVRELSHSSSAKAGGANA